MLLLPTFHSPYCSPCSLVLLLFIYLCVCYDCIVCVNMLQQRSAAFLYVKNWRGTNYFNRQATYQENYST